MEKSNAEQMQEIVAGFDGLVVFHFSGPETWEAFDGYRSEIEALFPKARTVTIPPSFDKVTYDKVIHEAQVAHAREAGTVMGVWRILQIGVMSDNVSLDEIVSLANQASAHEIYITPMNFFDLVDADLVMPKLTYHMTETLQIQAAMVKRNHADGAAVAVLDTLQTALIEARRQMGLTSHVSTAGQLDETITDRVQDLTANPDQPVPTQASVMLSQIHGLVQQPPVQRNYFYVWPQNQNAVAELARFLNDDKARRLLAKLNGIVHEIDVVGGRPLKPPFNPNGPQFAVIFDESAAGLVKDEDGDSELRDKLVEEGWDAERIMQVNANSFWDALMDMYVAKFGNEEIDEEPHHVFYSSRVTQHGPGTAKHVADLYNAQVNWNTTPMSPITVHVMTNDPVASRLISDFFARFPHSNVKHMLYVLAGTPSSEVCADHNARFFVVKDTDSEDLYAEQMRDSLISAGVQANNLDIGNVDAFMKFYYQLNDSVQETPKQEIKLPQLHVMTNTQEAYDKFAELCRQSNAGQEVTAEKLVDLTVYLPGQLPEVKWVVDPKVCYFFIAADSTDTWFVPHHVKMLNAGVDLRQGLAGPAETAVSFYEALRDRGE